MKKYISMIAASLMAVSCVDTIILPDDKTVDEDFWKTKGDVSLMVNGAYEKMGSVDVMQRLFVWGDLRSDEMVPTPSGTTTGTREALQQINTANMETTNTFAQWSSFYSVINVCNIVLERAAAVMEEDPNYSQGDYLSDRSQMLALRSLCYFYLVRTFRDVPYSTTAYMNSSQDFNVPQSAPDSVLQCCINDLEEAIPNAIAGNAYAGWKRVGWFNRDGMRALLADIYLWRASVLHSQSDYNKVIELCDLIIEEKQKQHIRGNELEEKEYPLATARMMFYNLFINQNAEESIFELQVNGQNNKSGDNYLGNGGVCQMLYKYASNSSGYGFLKAASIFSGTATNGTKVYRQTNDYRRNAFVYEADNTEKGSYDVRKMVEESNILALSPSTQFPRNGARAYTRFAQNYIFYRLTDIILMKAEAMVQLAQADDDIILRQAFNLVQAVNTRSIEETALSQDSLKWATFRNDGKEGIEQLVMDERLRELCFEGKRWYDLLRYNYRHVEGIDYSTRLAEQDDAGKAWVSNYTPMLTLMGRKFDGGGSAVTNKMLTEPYLYMPIPHRELVVCPVLRQNPVYSDATSYEKNY